VQDLPEIDITIWPAEKDSQEQADEQLS